MTNPFLNKELPEHIRNSPEFQMANMINQFQNDHAGDFAAISELRKLRQFLPIDCDHAASQLGLILSTDRRYSHEMKRLDAALSKNNAPALKRIVQNCGTWDDSAIIRRIDAWGLQIKQRIHLERIGLHLDAVEATKIAMLTIYTSSEVIDGKLVIGKFEDSLPVSAVTPEYHATPINYLVDRLPFVLADLAYNLATIPDTDFPEGLSGRLISTLSENLLEASGARDARAIQRSVRQVTALSLQ